MLVQDFEGQIKKKKKISQVDWAKQEQRATPEKALAYRKAPRPNTAWAVQKDACRSP